MQRREAKFTIAGIHAAPSRRQEPLFLSALAKEWDDVILGCRWPQGCGFLYPESNLLA